MSGLTRAERLFLTLVQAAYRRTEGYTLDLAVELVRQRGIRGFLRFGSATQAAWTGLVRTFGERDAHLLAGFASLWNGCGDCARGHLLAHNLLFFRETGELFPLDELEVPALLRERDLAIIGHLRERLGTAEHVRALRLIERQLLLKLSRAEPDGEEDRILCRSIAVHDGVSACSTTAGGEPPPPGRVALERELRERYAAARQSARARATPPGGDAEEEVTAGAPLLHPTG